ncbi:MAG: class I SAM-dependent methyltransferase [Pseudomonadota bacterium]
MSPPIIHWIEADLPCSAHWYSSSGLPPPSRVVIADDRMTADAAFRLASEGTAMLWRGDFQNARQLLQAMARRIDRGVRKPQKKQTASASVPAITDLGMTNLFNSHRQAQAQRARSLGRLLIPLSAGFTIALRRAPDIREACSRAYGVAAESIPESVADGTDATTVAVASLRELQGAIGAHEWRKKGVAVEALGARIHPHYGVFAPIRSEYVGLVASAALPDKDVILDVAFDIGTGTGVLAAVLAQRGVRRIVATDMDQRALACAIDNLSRLGYLEQVEVMHADLFPPGRAGLIVCNPPWLPARPSSPLEHAVYDPDSRMLRGFLNELAAHLQPGGEGWLILSDLAEHLGLRSRAELLAMIEVAGLIVLGQLDAKPNHPRVADTADILHAARCKEVTTLWRLGVKQVR